MKDKGDVPEVRRGPVIPPGYTVCRCCVQNRKCLLLPRPRGLGFHRAPAEDRMGHVCCFLAVGGDMPRAWQPLFSLDLDVLSPGEDRGFVPLLVAITVAVRMTPAVTFPSLCTNLPPLLRNDVRLSWARPPYPVPSAPSHPVEQEA